MHVYDVIVDATCLRLTWGVLPTLVAELKQVVEVKAVDVVVTVEV